jgi:hypothetical protein
MLRPTWRKLQIACCVALRMDQCAQIELGSHSVRIETERITPMLRVLPT